MGYVQMLEMALKYAKTDEQRRSHVLNFLENVCGPTNKERRLVKDFPAGLEWFNTKEPLSLQHHLRGRLVVLDFFTYCCINCMHILPDLEALEECYSVNDGLIVVGIHSAKFENEKASANLQNAILRYNISHAVVNDSSSIVWNELEVQCWPTLVLVSPSGEYLLPIVGEGNRKKMLLICDVAMTFFKSRGEIRTNNKLLMLGRVGDSLPNSLLLYPGKVQVDCMGNNLAVSDSGHNRVLVVSRAGAVLHCIGGLEKGFVDGSFESARFDSPQGLAWKKNAIYVADTKNHAIRKIDLALKTVETIAGMGGMGEHKCQWGGAPGPEQVLSSPWDLCLGGPEDNILFIAMAGSHQIWGLFLKCSTWLNNIEHDEGVCILYAGSGKEENRNNTYPRKASFAQPSGLVNPHEDYLSCMYVADSESSSIRRVSLKNGAVTGVVGGDLDPLNLFSFGDVDGITREAKLQHPMGIAWNPLNQQLYIADSYNHKIKVVDILKRSCTTLAGCGKPGWQDGSSLLGVKFDEPGGLCVSTTFRTVYVADTNNHSIRILNLEAKTVHKLNIFFPSASQDTPIPGVDSLSISASQPVKTLVPETTLVVTHPAIDVTTEGSVCLQVTLTLPDGCSLTQGGPSAWMAYIKGEVLLPVLNKTAISSLNDTLQHRWTVTPTTVKVTLRIEAVVCYCEGASGTCCMTELALEVPLMTSQGGSTIISIKHDICR